MTPIGCKPVALGFVALVASGAQAASAANPSFSCSGAKTPVEQAICVDPALSKLDAELDVAFRAELAADPAGKPMRLEGQRAWLRSRATACTLNAGTPEDTSYRGCLANLFKARLAAIKAHDPRDTPVCTAVAAAIRDAHGYVNGEPSLRKAHGYLNGEPSLAVALTKDPQSPVRFESRRETPTPALIAKLPKDPQNPVETDGARVYHFGTNRSLFALMIERGSMHCEYVSLFRIVSAGTIESIDEPAGLEDKCPTTSNKFGSTDAPTSAEAVPFDAVLSEGVDQASLDLWSRRDDHWHPACTVAVNYDTSLQVAARSCAPDAPCDALAAKALSLARTREMAGAKSPVRLGTAPLLPDAVTTEQLEVPSFGKHIDDAYTAFEPNAPVYATAGPNGPITVRISHGTVGWRTDENWLVGVYDRSPAMNPLAGFRITKSRTGLRNVLLK